MMPSAKCSYDIEDLKKVFDKVCDPDDWRAPIAVWVSGEAVLPVVAAIEFMTATHPREITENRERKTAILGSEGNDGWKPRPKSSENLPTREYKNTIEIKQI